MNNIRKDSNKMIAYKVKDGKVIEVKCEEMKYPLKDNEGDTIYENTHFKTKDEAYKRAIRDCEASISLVTSRLIEVRDKESELEKKLANKCIELELLKKEYCILAIE